MSDLITKEQLDVYEGAIFTSVPPNHWPIIFNLARKGLQLAEAEARVERLKTALEGMNELCGNYFDETQLVCARDKEIWGTMVKTLSEPASDSLRAYFRERTEGVVDALESTVNYFTGMGIDLPLVKTCNDALAKLKELRGEK